MNQTSKQFGTKPAAVVGVSRAGIPEMSSAAQISRLLGFVDMPASERPLFGHRRVKAGQYLVRAGDSFDELYVVNAGFFKAVFTDDAGNERIIAFPMKGALVGADGIGTRFHLNDVVALSEADVTVIPFADQAALLQMATGIESLLLRAISQQLIEEQLTTSTAATLCAETRLARFLITLGNQMGEQGFSRNEFVLQMSRQDIANYLSMKIETVSRTLTVLCKKGLIKVAQRDVRILDRDALEKVAFCGPGRKGQTMQTDGPGQSVLAAQAIGIEQRPSAKVATPWSGLTDLVQDELVAA